MQLDPSLVPQGATAKINCALPSSSSSTSRLSKHLPSLSTSRDFQQYHHMLSRISSCNVIQKCTAAAFLPRTSILKSLAHAGHAVGTQNYTAGGSGQYAPGGAVADLFLQNGTNIVGEHYFTGSGSSLTPVFTKTDAQVGSRSVYA